MQKAYRYNINLRSLINHNQLDILLHIRLQPTQYNYGYAKNNLVGILYYFGLHRRRFDPNHRFPKRRSYTTSNNLARAVRQ